MIIALTGFMCCGKSSIGRALSQRLGWRFVDLDEYIGHKKGMTVSRIFETEGETAFRALEAECLRDNIIMSKVCGTDIVLALGGGTMSINITRPLLLEETMTVYLKASTQILSERIGKGAACRPLLHGGDWKTLLEAREADYEKSFLTIETDGLSPDEICSRIEDALPSV